MELTSAPHEPGEREPAPPALRLVQEFVNTNDLEDEHDALASPDRLRAWLVERELIQADAAITHEAHQRTLDVREGLRALGRANNEEALDPARLLALNAAAGLIPLHVSLGPGEWSLAPASAGVDAFLGRMLASVAEAVADGSWSRMKACRNDTCRWLFFDHSRNRSGTWCTMALCGSRMKARAYRARQRDAGEA